MENLIIYCNSNFMKVLGDKVSFFVKSNSFRKLKLVL